ncbi:MAG: sulfatase-like hydrolase/transferase [Polyangiaceae bacterium]
MASVWEVQFGLLYLVPTWLVAAALVGAVATLVLRTAHGEGSRLERYGVCGLLAALALWAAWAVGGGRHLSSLPARAGFALGVAVVVGGASVFGLPRLGPLARRHAGGAALALLVLSVVSGLANLWVLPRLYPAFHAALSAFGMLAAGLSLATVVGARGLATQRGVVVLVVGALGALVLRPAAERLAGFDNFRLLLLDHAPSSGQLVLLMAKLAPPPPMDGACAEGECGPIVLAAGTESPLRWRGRDLLLVSIDALRADHVGSYGYGRKTTPHIDALAEEGTLFEHAYAPTPHTSYSVSSLMTGKYLRPLLLQGMGADSDTWPKLLRAYGYRTAAFYPPAVFFIDRERFASFDESGFGFEYRKREFLEGQGRAAQVASYLSSLTDGQARFVWVHLFAPHEPYEVHEGHGFGDRDLDRYDSEVAFADETLGKIVKAFRTHSPRGVVMVTADHGEEFGDHGGRYHGTTTYEEQVRVPLVVNAPGSVAVQRVPEVVQTIDLMPTVLAAMAIPIPPRVRGRDLGTLLRGKAAFGPGHAMAESEDQILLAEGNHRLICERRLAACRLYDLARDPKQRQDLAKTEAETLRRLRGRMHELSSSHGRYEVAGLRADGKGWPAAITRAAAGDPDAALDLAALLDDADTAVRRRAAELMFQMRREETAPALRLALERDEDADVRKWCALTLTRLGQGAPLVIELLKGGDTVWRRYAALALAESGDPRGGPVLVDWWKDKRARDYARSLELLQAFERIKEKDAVWPLTQSLDDVRLRPHIADTLAELGEEGARISLAKAFSQERYQDARVALARAVVRLDGGPEIAPALVRFLGVPDAMRGGVGLASEAGILQNIGGPPKNELGRLRRSASLGAELTLVVPKGGNGRGVRLLVRARAPNQEGVVVVAPPLADLRYNRKGEPVKIRDLPRLKLDSATRVTVPRGGWVELAVPAGQALGLKPGRVARLVVYAERSVEVDAVVAVPLSDELPPPAPKPWKPENDSAAPSPG